MAQNVILRRERMFGMIYLSKMKTSSDTVKPWHLPHKRKAWSRFQKGSGFLFGWMAGKMRFCDGRGEVIDFDGNRKRVRD